MRNPYSLEWSSSNPGFITILIDQSGSMIEDFENGLTKAEAAAEAVNWTIDSLITLNLNGEKVKNRCYLSLIGYGPNGTSQSIKFGSLSEIDDSPITYEERDLYGDTGSSYKLGIHVKPVSENGTPMAKGFEMAYSTIKSYIEKRPDAPAPIIINISDGMPNDKNETIKAVEKIQGLNSTDGNVLIYNAHLSKQGMGGQQLRFPNSKQLISNPHAQFLYDISSEIPEAHLDIAVLMGLVPSGSKGHRGCVFNAKAADLIGMLAFGTSTKTEINQQATKNFISSTEQMTE